MKQLEILLIVIRFDLRLEARFRRSKIRSNLVTLDILDLQFWHSTVHEESQEPFLNCCSTKIIKSSNKMFFIPVISSSCVHRIEIPKKLVRCVIYLINYGSTVICGQNYPSHKRPHDDAVDKAAQT